MPLEANGDDLVMLRVSVARMEGMLTQALTDQSQRVTKVEADVGVIHGRLSEKGKLLATHSEKIQQNHDRIEDIEERQKAAMPRTVAVIAPVIAAAALIVSLAQLIPWEGL